MSELFESKFNDGTGRVSILHNGSKGEPEANVICDCNCGEDRELDLSIKLRNGNKGKFLKIDQDGLREQFIPRGETEGIICSDGRRFLTVKEEYANNIIECCKE